LPEDDHDHDDGGQFDDLRRDAAGNLAEYVGQRARLLSRHTAGLARRYVIRSATFATTAAATNRSIQRLHRGRTEWDAARPGCRTGTTMAPPGVRREQRMVTANQEGVPARSRGPVRRRHAAVRANSRADLYMAGGRIWAAPRLPGQSNSESVYERLTTWPRWEWRAPSFADRLDFQACGEEGWWRGRHGMSTHEVVLSTAASIRRAAWRAGGLILLAMERPRLHSRSVA